MDNVHAEKRVSVAVLVPNADLVAFDLNVALLMLNQGIIIVKSIIPQYYASYSLASNNCSEMATENLTANSQLPRTYPATVILL